MNKFFLYLIKQQADNRQLESILLIILFIAIIIVLIFAGSSMPFLYIVAFGIVLVLILSAKKILGESKGGEFWLNMVKTNPENIVWIKPIVTKHTIGLVITLYKEQKFQLLTADDLSVVIKCNTYQDGETFFSGIIEYFPNAQFGYTPQIESLYKDDQKKFIANLKLKELYTPIASFSLSK